MLEPGVAVDRYLVEAKVGAGGMAEVYRVRHTLLGSLHALKVLRPALLHDEDIRERFLAEGRIQAQLCHPHIAAVTDLVSAAGVAGLVMEYLEGCTVEQRLATVGRFSGREAVEVLRPVLAAIAHAHHAGVVHRDLKPSNLFLCSRTWGMVRPVVLDFGVAKLKADTGLDAVRSRPTATGTRIGTVHYMSPEQVRGAASVDERTDLYSVGAILVELLTGQPPFDGSSEFEIMQRIVGGAWQDPTASLALRDLGLVAVMRRALAVEPDDRFPSAEAFQEALDDAIGPAPVRAGSAARGVVAPSQPVGAAQAPALPRATGPRLVLWPGADAERALPVETARVWIDPLSERVQPVPVPVGRSHAVLVRDEAGWSVEAHGRVQRTLVDGELIRGVRRLRGGEILLVGQLRLRFDLD